MIQEARPSSVVIVGGGICGAFTAYALARAGAAPVLVERTGAAREASVRNPGGWNPLHGAGIPGPLLGLALESYRRGLERWDDIAARSGIDFRGRRVTRVHLALDDADRAALEPMREIQQATPGFGARWLDRAELGALEPRLSPGAIGALRVEGNARICDPGAYTRAVTAAAVSLGARVVEGEVQALAARGDRAHAVCLASGDAIPCDALVVATGVWTDAPAGWLGVPLPVEMVKGELLQVEIAGPPVAHTYVHGDAHIYGDGTTRVWIGGTEERLERFDQEPTPGARAALLAGARRLFPSAAEGRVLEHTAGVRPVTADGLPIVGAAPGWENAYLALGAGRKGMLLSAGMGEAVAELALTGSTRLPIAACAPSRFAASRAREGSAP